MVLRPWFSGGDEIVRTKRLIAAATVGALLCAPALWAQTGDTEEVSQQTTSAEQAGQAAGQALDILELDSGPPVTYADVLRNPDDIQLNLRFARAQVNEGNVRGAATTLERILLIDPNLAQVRLFYAVILYRLENLDEAEKELRTVAALDIPADVRAEVDRYLDRIALARRLTRFTASLSLGL
jgi:tetratricopeptide (TPR) repeat protein